MKRCGLRGILSAFRKADDAAVHTFRLFPLYRATLRSLCIAMLVALLSGLAATAQEATLSAGDQANPNRSQDTTTSAGVGVRSALSAERIISILQDTPESIVELKQLLADRLTQQGTTTTPDAISDEMLYSQISSNADLRSSVTTFLRVRGYLTDADLQRAAIGSSAAEEDDPPALAQTVGTLSQLPRTDLLSSTFPSPDSTHSSTSAGMSPGNALPRSLTQSNKSNVVGASQRPADSHSTTNEPQVMRRPAPYNLLSLRDLYTQIPEQTAPLRRFGSDVFVRRDASSAARLGTGGQSAPLDIPLGPDYVIGPGDSLIIEVWGGISQTIARTIDREGRIALPESGSVQVAGLTLERVQAVIESALKQQYRNAHIDVTVARLRTVRVYVVGDVQRPGAYDLSSLSTPLNALYAAGGPTSVGSLRTLLHYRGKQLIERIDLYDFLLHGIRGGDAHFQGGDTLLAPPTGPQVAVSGAVKRPAIYELKDETTLASVLDDAGGATVAAALGHITVERIDANRQRETLTLDLPAESSPDIVRAAIATFAVKDGDRISVSPVLPYSERVVYLEGHVVRPGRLPYRDGLRLSDVLHSYRDLLPEPAVQGEIVRLVGPELHPETIDFNVPEILIGNGNFDLLPFDTVRIFGRYESDAPRVTIRGEVLRPASFPLSQGMTAAQLVRMAGGFKRDALLNNADLTSYEIVNDSKVVGQRTSIRIGDAVNKDDALQDVPLKPGDVLTVHQITGWNDIGASITIEGEVGHPGTYGFQQGEKLSSLLRRAGDFRDTAYPAGAVLVRDQVRELEEKSRAELIRQIETSSAAARLSPNLGAGDSSATLQLIHQQQDQVLSRLRSQPATGRLVIHISADIDSWANTPADIEVRSGDVLTIPKRPGFVLVSGQVYNASAITFAPGRTAGWYLKHAGGTNDVANRKDIFIVRANGSVVGRHSGEWFDSNVLSTRLAPGDVVVVPQKIIGASLLWRNLLTTAQIASSIAITAAIAGL